MIWTCNLTSLLLLYYYNYFALNMLNLIWCLIFIWCKLLIVIVFFSFFSNTKNIAKEINIFSYGLQKQLVIEWLIISIHSCHKTHKTFLGTIAAGVARQGVTDENYATSAIEVCANSYTYYIGNSELYHGHDEATYKRERVCVIFTQYIKTNFCVVYF